MSKRLEELVGLWSAAEQRLYPIVTAQPEIYERYLGLVRIVADELGSARTPEQLAEAYGDAAEIVEAVMVRGGLVVEGLDLGVVAGAAFGLRYKEVLAEAHRGEAARRLRAARARGDRWVVVYEAAGAGGPRMPPYRKLEMHLADGVGLHVFVELGPDMDRPVYGVEVVRLDPWTGDWVDEPAPLTGRETFPDPESWERTVEHLRARLGGGSGLTA